LLRLLLPLSGQVYLTSRAREAHPVQKVHRITRNR